MFHFLESVYRRESTSDLPDQLHYARSDHGVLARLALDALIIAAYQGFTHEQQAPPIR